MSEVLDVAFGVPQGSVLGPLLFILITGDLPKTLLACVDPGTNASASLYADDTSAVAASKTWEETEVALKAMTDELEKYSHRNSLHLNLAKTQELKIGHPDTKPSDELNILGIVLDRTASFETHHSNVLADLRRRIGVVRRLRTRLSRGRLLSEIGRSLIIGRVQGSAWVTRNARLSTQQNGPMHQVRGQAQTVINDLARIILGVTRADHYKVEDLLDRADLPSINEIVVRQSALASWKATQGGCPCRIASALRRQDQRVLKQSEETHFSAVHCSKEYVHNLECLVFLARGQVLGRGKKSSTRTSQVCETQVTRTRQRSRSRQTVMAPFFLVCNSFPPQNPKI